MSYPNLQTQILVLYMKSINLSLLEFQFQIYPDIQSKFLKSFSSNALSIVGKSPLTLILLLPLPPPPCCIILANSSNLLSIYVISCIYLSRFTSCFELHIDGHDTFISIYLGLQVVLNFIIMSMTPFYQSNIYPSTQAYYLC